MKNTNINGNMIYNHRKVDQIVVALLLERLQTLCFLPLLQLIMRPNFCIYQVHEKNTTLQNHLWN